VWKEIASKEIYQTFKKGDTEINYLTTANVNQTQYYKNDPSILMKAKTGFFAAR